MIRAGMKTSCMLLAIVMPALSLAAADGAWMKNVPTRDHERTNPYSAQPDVIAAGKKIFVADCTPCHGENAEGTKNRPALRSERVQRQATDGDLHWILVNGNMKKGMPSWAGLPDPQLWQVIAYVKSLHP